MLNRSVFFDCGEVAEWLKATVLKTVVRVSVPWVRIPPSLPMFMQVSRVLRRLASDEI